jgi:valyl-tRNA synthetase
MTEKRQTSQGYIIHILQHFATKLWNITNFVMLFQAVVKLDSTEFFPSSPLALLNPTVLLSSPFPSPCIFV